MIVKAKLDMLHPKFINSHYGSIFREQETIVRFEQRVFIFNKGVIYICAKLNNRPMEQSFQSFYQLLT